MARPRVVILGGGFAGLFTALELGSGDVDVTLVTDEDHFLFTPMLYEYLSGEVEPGISPHPTANSSKVTSGVFRTKP